MPARSSARSSRPACRCSACCSATTASSRRRATSGSCRPRSATTPPHALDRLAAQIAEKIDLDQLLALARSAPDLDAEPWDAARREISAPRAKARPVVAMAGGRAFTFRYAETEELLRAAGCDVVTFDPLADEALPEGTAGLYLGGGFPEVHAAGLSANAPLREALRAAVDSGMPTYAECAGLLYLCRSVDGMPMVGALDAEAAMTPRLTLSLPHRDRPGRPADRRRRHPGHAATSSTGRPSPRHRRERRLARRRAAARFRRRRRCTRRTSTPTGPATRDGPTLRRRRARVRAHARSTCRASSASRNDVGCEIPLRTQLNGTGADVPWRSGALRRPHRLCGQHP